MAYKQAPGRMNMPKTGRGVDAATLMTGTPATFTSTGDKKKKEKNVAKQPPKKKLVASKLSERKHFEKGVNKSFISDIKNKGFVAAVKDNFRF